MQVLRHDHIRENAPKLSMVYVHEKKMLAFIGELGTFFSKLADC
jgi:hypothetical protein